MKEVCSCGAKFDTLEGLYQHVNAEMSTDYSLDEFAVALYIATIEEREKREARLSALLSSPHHGFTLVEE